ncbi:unnamed protein product [Caenorhabditis angaria]|uniref:Uncharacterized protein n=1 Tax=Caenorhabditis angaria TaxID=860376 RepID=A0A9P1I4N8_9PELO|nr:unnamed protein product [Caenorhabditis angaria]
MSLECPTEAPYYFKFVLHTLGLISIPINSLGCYLVIFHSAKHTNYKYCLLYLQIVTFIVEIYMSWIAPGYYFFPMIGGYITNSFVAQFVSGHFSVVFYFFFFAFEMPALVVCFQTRHDYVAELKREMKLSKYLTQFMVHSCHLFPFAVSTLLFFSELPYEKQYEIIAREYPKCLHVLKIQGFALYDYKENVYFLSVGILVFLALLIYGGYMIFLSIYTNKKKKKNK